MEQKISVIFETQFGEEVYEGLTHNPKHLSSKYFYDQRGDDLFQRIMEMPEYYLTHCEFEILEKNKSKITDWFVKGTDPFDLIELGAGDGKKTKILLKYLSEKNIDFCYTPIDISENVLGQLKASLKEELAKVRVNPIQGAYFEALKNAFRINDYRKVILFLGSNIGNLKHGQAIEFLGHIQEIMHEDDLLFVGFDQKKHPQTILKRLISVPISLIAIQTAWLINQ